MNDRTIALAQIDPVLGDFEANIRTHAVKAHEAAAEGADLIVFPELSLTGYSVKDMNIGLSLNPSLDNDSIQPLLEASRSISILAGGIEEDASYALYNAAFLFEQGRIRSVHRKIYPPTYGMFEERRYFSPGTSVRSVSLSSGDIGVLICEDLWHLPLPYLLAQQGVQVIVGLVASPTRVVGSSDTLAIQMANSENHRAYARLLSCYLVFCNRVGFEDGTQFWGGSSVVGPDGNTISEAPLFEEHLLVVNLKGNEVRRARQASRHFLDDDPRMVLRALQNFAEEETRPRSSD